MLNDRHPQSHWLMLLAFVGSSCGFGAEGFPTGLQPSEPIAEFVRNGVRVEFKFQQDADGGGSFLTTHFSPIEVGYYLYGTGLPPEGIQGLGVPTRVDIVKADGASIDATMTAADREAHLDHIQSLNIYLPIFDPGPVTLAIPVIAVEPNAAATVAVSYMACRKSDGTCLPPVREKVVELQLAL